ncbi:MAG: CBS domain-containing protein [Pseudomonadota bacterium]
MQDVLDDLQASQKEYIDYHVLYFYVVDNNDTLVGVLRMHDLLFPSRQTKLSQIMISSPFNIPHQTSLKALENFFDDRHLFGAPAIDDENRMIGVVLSSDVEDALNKKKTS